MFTRLFYESQIVGRFGPLVLLGLQKNCVRRNRERGITSFLYHDGIRIMQILEGSAEEVDVCYKEIAKSELHRNLKIRAVMRCEERQFKRWYFGATNKDDPDFRRATGALAMPDLFGLDILQAEKLLQIVASRKRRAVKMDLFSVKVGNFVSGEKPRALFAVDKARNGIP